MESWVQRSLSEILISLCLCLLTLQRAFCTESHSLEVTVKSHLGAGFFAELTKVISHIKHYEPLNLKRLHVDWTQEFFPYKTLPFENGWDHYFEPILIDSTTDERAILPMPNLYRHDLHDQQCIDHWMTYQEHLPYRLSIHRILSKYLKIKQPLLSELSRLYDQHLNGFYCIGVHVRWSAAHASEVPKGNPSIEDYINEVREVIAHQVSNLPIKIYLATDSQVVLKKFQEHFPKKMIAYIDTHRSPNREDPHLIYENAQYWLEHPDEFHRKKPGYQGGLSVLLDCLLLSKCDIFIHSTSNVAEFVSFYNPYIESIYLPKNPHSWPCRYTLLPL